MSESKYTASFKLQNSKFDCIDLIFRFHNGVNKYVYDFDVKFRKDKPALLDPAPN